jgi:hypothetical protein
MIRGQNTLEFLKTCIVSIAGRNAAGEADYWISKRVASRDDKHEWFEIKGRDPGLKFRAQTVPMVNRTTLDSLANIGGVHLDMSGSDVMVTGMLTSCTLLFSGDKRDMYCTHVEPPRGTGGSGLGLQLGVELMNGAKFSNTTGSVRAFTRREYDSAHHANVLGVRRLDGWSIYCQAMSTDHKILFATQLI